MCHGLDRRWPICCQSRGKNRTSAVGVPGGSERGSRGVQGSAKPVLNRICCHFGEDFSGRELNRTSRLQHAGYDSTSSTVSPRRSISSRLPEIPRGKRRLLWSTWFSSRPDGSRVRHGSGKQPVLNSQKSSRHRLFFVQLPSLSSRSLHRPAPTIALLLLLLFDIINKPTTVSIRDKYVAYTVSRKKWTYNLP